MSAQFEPTNCNYTSLHEILINNFRVIFTTNYDAAFEKFCQRHDIAIISQKLHRFSSTTLFQNRTIVYLHGNNDDRIYIFRKEEYDHFYPSISEQEGTDDLERFLYEVLSTDHLIFIGFSFNDTYFLRYFKKVINEIISKKEKKEKGYESVLKKKIKMKEIQHFAILPDSNKEIIEELRDLEKLGVFRAITYSGNHTEIESIIESIMPSVIGGSLEEEAANAR